MSKMVVHSCQCYSFMAPHFNGILLKPIKKSLCPISKPYSPMYSSRDKVQVQLNKALQLRSHVSSSSSAFL